MSSQLINGGDLKKSAVIDVDIAFETPTLMRFLAQYKKNEGLFG
jgi:hypothetical protein